MSILRKMIRLNSQVRKAFQGNSRGLTLVEVAIGIALVGVIAVAILSALSAASAWLTAVDARATAESLVRSQMADVKNQPYDSINATPQYTKLSEIPDGYDIAINATRLNPNEDDPTNDDGIQQITVTVSYDILRYNISTQLSKAVPEQFTLVGYKREPVT